MTNNIIKAVSYRRTATSTGVALKRQEEQTEMVCNNKVYELVGTYFDAGTSGRTDKRAGFQRMMKDMKDKKFNKIIVTDISRISRNATDLANFFSEVEKHGCAVETVSEKINTSDPMGAMFTHMLRVFAQFESELKNNERR